MFISQ